MTANQVIATFITVLIVLGCAAYYVSEASKHHPPRSGWTPNRAMPAADFFETSPTPRVRPNTYGHKSRVRWLVKQPYRVPELQTRWGNTHSRMRRLTAR